MREVVFNGAAAAAGFVAMEAIAWAAHRYLMHGPLWALHRSHHQPGRGPFQANDLFGLLFASVAVLLFWIGAARAAPALWWAAAGVTVYGAVYAIVHDGLIHRRFGRAAEPKSAYLRRVLMAHRLHHATVGKSPAVAFGLLWPADIQALKRRLKQSRAR